MSQVLERVNLAHLNESDNTMRTFIATKTVKNGHKNLHIFICCLKTQHQFFMCKASKVWELNFVYM